MESIIPQQEVVKIHLQQERIFFRYKKGILHVAVYPDGGYGFLDDPVGNGTPSQIFVR